MAWRFLPVVVLQIDCGQAIDTLSAFAGEARLPPTRQTGNTRGGRLDRRLRAERGGVARDAHERVHRSDRVADEDAYPLRDIFIFAGQSNCVGIAKLSDVPRSMSNQLTPPAHVYAWPKMNGQEWTQYDPLSSNKFNLDDHFGPEVSFIHELSPMYLRRHESVGVLKVAAIGTSLRKDWALAGWENLIRNSSRLQNFRHHLATREGELLKQMRTGVTLGTNASTPGLFAMLVDSALAAMNSPQCDGGRCQVKGMIWVQGEADAGLPKEDGRLYEAELDNLVSTLRKALESPEMFVAVAQLAPDLGHRASGQLVLDAQNDWTRKQGSKRAALIPTGSITKQEDHLHYDAAGYIKLGQLAARAYLKSLE